MSTPETGDARRVVVGASLVFAVLLVAGGALILWVRDVTLASMFNTDDRGRRIAIGAGTGVLAALSCAVIVYRVPALARLRRLAEHAIDGIEPGWHTVAIVSLAAGISEEFFFRGALEPVVGSWLASLAFMALHGAFRLRDRGVAAFAAFLFLASTGLSAVNAWKGLEAAMAAHAAYDAVMFAWLAKAASRHSVA
jgi:membrane protease YdiL (CAAX protease family)